MHRTVAAAVLAALALGVASCGSSEPPLTRAELVSRVEVACRSAQKLGARKARSSGSTSDQQRAFVDSIQANQQAVMDKVSDLHPAAAAKDAFERFKQGEQARLDMIKRLDGITGAKLQRAVAAVSREAEALTKRLEAAKTELGIRNCS